MKKLTESDRPNRIREWRMRRDMTQDELAELVGLTNTAVSKIEKGQRRLSDLWIDKFSKALGCRPAELLNDDSSETVVPEANAVPAPEIPPIAPAGLPKDVPVLGSVIGGDSRGTEVDFSLNGETIDYVRRPPGIDKVKSAFALFVQGESMWPWKGGGQLIYVNPDRPPALGGHVVVELHPEEEGGDLPCLVKRLLKTTGTTYTLGQYNPKRDDIVIPRNRVRAIYRVLEQEELLGI